VQPDKFYSDAGKVITVPFMNRQGHFGYFENDELQTLVIPYRENQLQMIILLPRKRDGIDRLESRLAPASFAAWTSKTRSEEVKVAMPKFKMSGAFKLTETLRALGLEDAFDAARADFSGMDGRLHWLYLSAVLHRAFIEVNEKGTEAAAATALVARTASISTRQPREFRADHPFVFLIRESTTGTILFMGRVSVPENN
jgi:serpin B